MFDPTARPLRSESVPELISPLSEARAHPDAVAEALATLVRRPEVIERAIGVDDRCGVTTLLASTGLTIQRIVWPAGIRIPPHDHRMWAVTGVYRGVEDNQLFRRHDDGLEPIGRRNVETGTVLSLECDAIHSVANPASAPCVALHVYGGDLDGTARSTWGPAGDERSFDPEAMRAAIALLRAREDELGRPLTAEETSALIRPG